MSNDFKYSSGNNSDRQKNSSEKSFDGKLFKDSGFTMDKLIKKHVEEIGENIATSDSKSQTRAFYDEVLRLKALATKEDFQKVKPLIYLLSSKAAYAKGRGAIKSYLMGFIQNNIKLIENEQDLEDFALYFEAVYGYYKFHVK